MKLRFSIAQMDYSIQMNHMFSRDAMSVSSKSCGTAAGEIQDKVAHLIDLVTRMGPTSTGQ